MLFLRRKMSIAFLVLAMAGGQVSAKNTDHVAQAKQKASDVRDWSVQAAGKVREKANEAYAVTCQKARALYEQAKEHKKLIAGAAYLMFEGIGCYNGWRTPLYRLFVLPGQLDANIENLTGQLNIANEATVNINNRLNDVHQALLNRDFQVIPGLNNQIGNLDDQLRDANANMSKCNETIERLNNQATRFQNTQLQMQQSLNTANGQVLELTQNNDARMQDQEKNLREIHVKGITQGRAQADLNQKYNAVIENFNKLNQEFQGTQATGVDSAGIITDVMLQVRELMACRELAQIAYPDQEDNLAELNEVFKSLATLTEQVINHVVNQIKVEAEWLENATKEMNFSGITAENFDGDLTCVYADIDNYFAQLNNTFAQLGWLVASSQHNKMIQSCLATCDADSIVQSLGAMLVHSFDKIQQLGLLQDGNTIVVKSHDDAFNLYTHSLVASHAYQSYVTCCSMLPNAKECLDWAQPFEAPIFVVHTCIQNGNVQMRVNNVRSMLLNSNSIMGVSRFNLDRSVVEDVDLDAFFESTIEPMVKPVVFKNGFMSGIHFGGSSMFASSVDYGKDIIGSSSAIGIDDLLDHYVNKVDEDWNAELDAMGKSVIGLKDSFVKSSLLFSGIGKSTHVEEKVNMAASVIESKMSSSINESCPFISSAIWGKQQEQLANSYNFDNRVRFSRVANFGPNGWQDSGMHGRNVRRNNNNSPKLPDSSIINNVSVIMANRSVVNHNGANNSTTYSTLVNEFGDKESTVNASHSVELEKDSLFEAQARLFERNEKENLSDGSNDEVPSYLTQATTDPDSIIALEKELIDQKK